MVPPKTLIHSEPHDQPSHVVPQHRRYPQPKQLGDAERLDHVIVRTGIKTANGILIF
jgi:hypothetical protein